MQPPPPLPRLAAILAGGASRRFGAPKALARIGGLPVVRRVRDALGAVADEAIVVTADAEIARAAGLPARADRDGGLGPLEGVRVALTWALERRGRGALVVGCDLPFLAPSLLGAILRRSAAPADAIVPESESRRGFEPLCAWYSVALLGRIEDRLRAGDRDLTGLVAAADAVRIPLAEVREHGDPAVLFLNVNTPADLARAERISGGDEAYARR